jgi:hypothetical protein
MENIHVLPTDKPSRIYLIKSNNKLGITSNNPEFTENFGSGTQNQQIYITSDEEIKEGDWYYYFGFIIKYEKDENTLTTNCKKIILTTDQNLIKDGVQAIDDEFLQWFVNNPSCEEVEIINTFDYIKKGYVSHSGHKIIIPKEEQKKVMFKFDDNEPEQIGSIVGGDKFIIELKEGSINFEKDGKTFKLYIETI